MSRLIDLTGQRFGKLTVKNGPKMTIKEHPAGSAYVIVAKKQWCQDVT